MLPMILISESINLDAGISRWWARGAQAQWLGRADCRVVPDPLIPFTLLPLADAHPAFAPSFLPTRLQLAAKPFSHCLRHPVVPFLALSLSLCHTPTSCNHHPYCHRCRCRHRSAAHISHYPFFPFSPYLSLHLLPFPQSVPFPVPDCHSIIFVANAIYNGTCGSRRALYDWCQGRGT